MIHILFVAFCNENICLCSMFVVVLVTVKLLWVRSLRLMDEPRKIRYVLAH